MGGGAGPEHLTCFTRRWSRMGLKPRSFFISISNRSFLRSWFQNYTESKSVRMRPYGLRTSVHSRPLGLIRPGTRKYSTSRSRPSETPPIFLDATVSLCRARVGIASTWCFLQNASLSRISAQCEWRWWIGMLFAGKRGNPDVKGSHLRGAHASEPPRSTCLPDSKMSQRRAELAELFCAAP